MLDFLIVVALIVVIGGILYYLHRERKKGHSCVGCPYAGECGKAQEGGCSQDSANRF